MRLIVPSASRYSIFAFRHSQSFIIFPDAILAEAKSHMYRIRARFSPGARGRRAMLIFHAFQRPEPRCHADAKVACTTLCLLVRDIETPLSPLDGRA